MNTPSELQLVFPDGHQSVWPLAAGEQPQEDYRAVKLPFGFVALGPTGMPGQYSQGAMQVQQDRVAGKPLQGRKHLPAIFMTDGQASIAFTPTDHPEKEQWVYRAITLPDGSVLTWYEDGTAVLNWPLPANDTMRRRAQTLLA
jgi:hypothetical protein